MPTTIVTPRVRRINVRQDGDRVLVTEGSELIFNLPWEVALEFARALRAKAKLAEEEAKALQVIEDQALLDSAGVPLLLTRRADIREAAAQLAGIPPIASREVFGVPRLIQHGPKKRKEGYEPVWK